jgi:hypothetical protein
LSTQNRRRLPSALSSSVGQRTLNPQFQYRPAQHFERADQKAHTQSPGYCLLRILAARCCCMRQHCKMASGYKRKTFVAYRVSVGVSCSGLVVTMRQGFWSRGRGAPPREQQVYGSYKRLISNGFWLIQEFITNGFWLIQTCYNQWFLLIQAFITNGFWLIKRFITNGFWLKHCFITNGFWLCKRFITNGFWLIRAFYNQWFLVETIFYNQ